MGSETWWSLRNKIRSSSPSGNNLHDKLQRALEQKALFRDEDVPEQWVDMMKLLVCTGFSCGLRCVTASLSSTLQKFAGLYQHSCIVTTLLTVTCTKQIINRGCTCLVLIMLSYARLTEPCATKFSLFIVLFCKHWVLLTQKLNKVKVHSNL